MAVGVGYHLHRLLCEPESLECKVKRLRTGPARFPVMHALAPSPQQCSEPTLGLKLTETEGVGDPHTTGRSSEGA